ncbi:ABC transporter ATP-binding protein [Rhizobium sp.]|uniref:ABC transporter ATP-binding protein n=1 Tax=Rhizobium sp. TaxID=391 RepID=UPI000E8E4469|nr:ABC transporter ATP-binding protein [Rhizobium sp.]
MAELELHSITKSFGETVALHPTSLQVHTGEFVTVLGPSGCGKSTLLRILMGIMDASGGEIRLAGQRIEALPPEKRDIAMVFQSYALFPHMSVRKNLAFGLKMRKVAKDEQIRRINHALEICNLAAYVDRMPRQLSGGQQQRVALARAIVMQPSLLLFDEPLSNLDAKLRDSLRHDLLALHRKTGSTSLYVTHDQTEAMAMSDRIVVMNAGRVVEIGTPVELYRNPANAFTAGFLGQTNLLTVTAHGATCGLPWGGDGQLDRPAQGLVSISLRPENIMLTQAPDGAGEIIAASFMGAHAHYIIRIAGMDIQATRSGVETLLATGTRVQLTLIGALRVLKTDGLGAEAA